MLLQQHKRIEEKQYKNLKTEKNIEEFVHKFWEQK